MFSVSHLVVPYLLWLGWLVGKVDRETGRIPNRLLLGALWRAALFYAAVGVACALSPGALGPVALPEDWARWVGVALANGALLLVIGFVRWDTGALGPADAKVLALFAFALPPDIASRHGLVVGWAPLALGLNSFVLAALRSVALGVRQRWRSRRAAALAATPTVTAAATAATDAGARGAGEGGAPERDGGEDGAGGGREALAEAARMAYGALVVISVLTALRMVLRDALGRYAHLSGFTLWALLFVVSAPLGTLMRRPAARWAGLALLVATFAGHAWAGDLGATAGHFGFALAMSAGIGLSRAALVWLAEGLDEVPVTLKGLAPGQILAESTVRRIEADRDWRERWAPHVGDLRQTRLELGHIRDVTYWYEHGRHTFPLRRLERFAFGPWLGAGLLLTVLCRGSLFELFSKGGP